MQTGAWPELIMPMRCAAALERSMMRPRMKGPRSLMRTITLLPVRLLVTRTFVPKGRLRWAAVMAEAFMRSPEAVLEERAYHDALPHWAEASRFEAARVAPAAK